MLESKALNLNPGSGGEYIIKKKNNIENNTQKLEQPDRNFEYKKSDSINGKRMSSIPLNGKCLN